MLRRIQNMQQWCIPNYVCVQNMPNNHFKKGAKIKSASDQMENFPDSAQRGLVVVAFVVFKEVPLFNLPHSITGRQNLRPEENVVQLALGHASCDLVHNGLPQTNQNASWLSLPFQVQLQLRNYCPE